MWRVSSFILRLFGQPSCFTWVDTQRLIKSVEPNLTTHRNTPLVIHYFGIFSKNTPVLIPCTGSHAFFVGRTGRTGTQGCDWTSWPPRRACEDKIFLTSLSPLLSLKHIYYEHVLIIFSFHVFSSSEYFIAWPLKTRSRESFTFPAPDHGASIETWR